MKTKRKKCLILRMVSSSNPIRATKKLFQIQKDSRPSAQIHWRRIETTEDEINNQV